MLLLSGERVRQAFHILRLVVVYLWMQRACDFANEQSDLFYQVAALFNVINLQRKQNGYKVHERAGLLVCRRNERVRWENGV